MITYVGRSCVLSSVIIIASTHRSPIVLQNTVVLPITTTHRPEQPAKPTIHTQAHTIRHHEPLTATDGHRTHHAPSHRAAGNNAPTTVPPRKRDSKRARYEDSMSERESMKAIYLKKP